MIIVPNLGIGDIIIWKIYSHYYNIEIDTIYIKQKIVETYRSHPKEYMEFINYLFSKLFPTAKLFTVNEFNMIEFSKSSETSTPDKLFTKIQNTYLFNTIKFNMIYNIQYTNYIIFHTKLRLTQYGYSLFNENMLYIFFSHFQTTKQIILIGEQEIDDNLENKIHGIKSIYGLLKLLHNNNNVIDLTKPTIHNSNSIDDFERDAQLINGAKCNISLGIGGNFVLSSAFAKLTIGFAHPSESYYIEKMNSDTVKISSTVPDLIELINTYAS